MLDSTKRVGETRSEAENQPTMAVSELLEEENSSAGKSAFVTEYSDEKSSIGDAEVFEPFNHAFS